MPSRPPTPPAREELLAATNRYLTAFASNRAHPLTLLTYFSTTSPVTIQHYPSTCPHPEASLMSGSNAIRSYFDLLATHWIRTHMHSRILELNTSTRTAVIQGSMTWTWKSSGRSWIEDFTCTVTYDEVLKIISFSVRTESPARTCVMRAKDIDYSPPHSSLMPSTSHEPTVQGRIDPYATLRTSGM